MKPLAALHGLKAFLVYVAWPVCPGKDEARLADEQMLEKMVMGPSCDSSKLRLRADPKSSYRYFRPEFFW